MELNKTEEKYLALIEPYLETLQEFVDEHIKDGNTLTAAAIHEGYLKEYETESDIADEDEFVKGFRLAVRVGKIVGIESAKRLGYRRIGDSSKTKTATEASLEQIAPYLESLQAFVELHFQGNTKMTAAAIYERFKDESGCDLDEETFIKGFRVAVSQNKIGLTTAYRFGYKRAGTRVEEDGTTVIDTEDDDTSTPIGAEIRIGEGTKIVRIDKYNWVMMVLNDSGSWVRKGYYGNSPWSAVHMAERLLKAETDRHIPYDVKDLLNTVKKAQDHLAKLLEDAIKLARNAA